MPQTHHFKSVPNFRRLVPTGIPTDLCENQGRSRGQPLNLYRSSRPDLLSAEEVIKFEQLNIRSVVDLRSTREYRRADGPKLLDSIYPLYEVLLFTSVELEPHLTRMIYNSHFNLLCKDYHICTVSLI